jgi:hypothetical protein
MENNQSLRITQMLINRDSADYMLLNEAFGSNAHAIYQDHTYHMLVYLNGNMTQILHYNAFDDIDNAKTRYALSFERLLSDLGGLSYSQANLLCSFYGIVDAHQLSHALGRSASHHNSPFLDAICGVSNGFLVYKYQLVLLYRNITKCSLTDANDFVRDWNKKLPYTRYVAHEIMYNNMTLYEILVSKRLFEDFEFYISSNDEYENRLLNAFSHQKIA